MAGQAPSPIESKVAIGERLQRTREALDLDQAEFCRRAGIAPNTYNQWERGKGRPSLDEAKKIRRQFGISLDWIYFGDPSGLPLRISGKLAATGALAALSPLTAVS